MVKEIMKVVMIAVLPSPYWVDFLNRIGKSIELVVYFQNKQNDEREDSWLNTNFENFQAYYLPKDKLERFNMLKKISIQEFDLFWNCNYSSIDCIYLTRKFKKANKKILMHADGGIVIPRLIDPMISKVMNMCDYFASSGNECDKYYKYYKVSSLKIKHYRFTSLSSREIQSNLDYAEMLRNNNPNLKNFTIVAVGRQIYSKGYDVLLKALSLINLDMEVNIVGGNPTELNLKLKKDLNLNYVNFVQFLPMEELKDYYASANLFILPTRSDVWGLVINEAMSFGLPIITTDKCAGGIELINKYDNGVLFRSEDFEELAKIISNLYQNRDLLQKYTKNSVVGIHEYSLENMVNDYLSILETVTGGVYENTTN